MKIRRCLHCGGSLGFRKFMKTNFCSEEHARADAGQMQALMIERLQSSALRFRTALGAQEHAPRPRPVAVADSSADMQLVCVPKAPTRRKGSLHRRVLWPATE